jgi:hypothetical protein
MLEASLEPFRGISSDQRQEMGILYEADVGGAVLAERK